MEIKLARSRHNRVLSGVCGGIGEHFSIDPTIIRIIWIAIGLAGGAGVIAYIIAAIVMPEGGYDSYNQSSGQETYNQGTYSYENSKNDWGEPVKYNSTKTNFILGGVLIIIGVMFFVKQIMPWFNFHFMFPAILILIGIGVISRSRRF